MFATKMKLTLTAGLVAVVIGAGVQAYQTPPPVKTSASPKEALEKARADVKRAEAEVKRLEEAEKGAADPRVRERYTRESAYRDYLPYLSAPYARNTVEAAKSALAKAATDVRRAKGELDGSKGGPPEALGLADARLKQAETAVAAAEAALKVAMLEAERDAKTVRSRKASSVEERLDALEKAMSEVRDELKRLGAKGKTADSFDPSTIEMLYRGR